MQAMIDHLKGNLPSSLSGTDEVFDLLLAACSYCCTNYTGGNESCPPKTQMAQE